MNNKKLLIIAFILSIIYVVLSSSYKTTTFYTNIKKEINVKNKNNSISKLDLEEYIIGVVAAEMPASFHEEALKAQAIASRTYAVFKINTSTKDFDVVTDVSNQSYITIDEMKNKWGSDFDKYYSKIKNAVNETSNMIMYYDNEVVEAYYFAMSNGYTEDSELVFSIDKDYLKSVEINYDKKVNNYEVTKEFSKKEICNKLNIKCDSFNVNDVNRSLTNRVNTIKINNNEYKGTDFRRLLNLRSTDFDIDINEDNIIITTRGYGHGVGMSQYGANGMALDGYKYEDILKYFYKNIKISTI